jgi:hypothetical protein
LIKSDRPRSGNPGYITNKPVLYGTSSGNYISESSTGFTIQKPSFAALGKCPTSLDSLDLDPESIHFGYDLLLTCLVSLNRSELIKFCCEGADLCDTNSHSQYSQTNGVPVFLQPLTGSETNFLKLSHFGRSIGEYGNADPLDPSQWLPIKNSIPPTSNRRWLDFSSTCSGMITGFLFCFFVQQS